MFGKRPPDHGLTERVRKLAERPSPPSDTHATPTRARAERQALFRQATLIVGDGERLRVAVKNLSASGARIEFFTHSELPLHVELVEPTMKLRTRARVVWQRGGAAGLRFDR